MTAFAPAKDKRQNIKISNVHATTVRLHIISISQYCRATYYMVFGKFLNYLYKKQDFMLLESTYQSVFPILSTLMSSSSLSSEPDEVLSVSCTTSAGLGLHRFLDLPPFLPLLLAPGSGSN